MTSNEIADWIDELNANTEINDLLKSADDGTFGRDHWLDHCNLIVDYPESLYDDARFPWIIVQDAQADLVGLKHGRTRWITNPSDNIEIDELRMICKSYSAHWSSITGHGEFAYLRIASPMVKFSDLALDCFHLAHIHHTAGNDATAKTGVHYDAFDKSLMLPEYRSARVL